LPDLDFVLVGGTVQGGPPNLRSYGTLPQAEADRVMASCTVGLSSLALHRKQMFEASPLKSRNYLALGLPLIQAYEDTDLSERDGCVLELPNCEGSALEHTERIRAFAWRAYEDPSLSEKARTLATGRLSLQAKEAARLALIAQCVREHEAR